MRGVMTISRASNVVEIHTRSWGLVRRNPGFAIATLILFVATMTNPIAALSNSLKQDPSDNKVLTTVTRYPGTNLVEFVPPQYLERYNQWKKMFLSTPIGRRLWLRFAVNPGFKLTIVVVKTLGHGAKVDSYEWSEGQLAGATIILGSELGNGYPSEPYYPVLVSLSQTNQSATYIEGDVLAAAKIAHEFGHLSLTASADSTTYQLQNRLARLYYMQFVSNGFNAKDPALVELARRSGGRPEELHERREYWAESYALRYLQEKLSAKCRRRLLSQLRKLLDSMPPTDALRSREWTRLIMLSEAPAGQVLD
jgi:hypothetical protein